MIYRTSQIKLSYGEDLKYFHILFEAILKVHKKYVTYEIHAPHEGWEEHLERVFAYELYHQWAKQLEINDAQNLVLNGEVYKHLVWKTICYDCDSKPTIKGVYPDLVLHSSQGNDKNQKMICEIKREVNISSEALFADFLKLSCYLRKKSFQDDFAPFDYGVFILVGDVKWKDITVDENTTVKWKEEYVTLEQYKKQFSETFSHIICIAYNGNGKSLEYDTLKNILKV